MTRIEQIIRAARNAELISVTEGIALQDAVCELARAMRTDATLGGISARIGEVFTEEIHRMATPYSATY